MIDSLSATNIVVLIAVILLSVSFHEAMHAFTAHWLGDPTAYEEGRLTLNPLKHLDLFTSFLLPLMLVLLHLPPFFIAKPVPFNPHRVKYGEFGAALVGLAGPLTNLVLGLVGAVFLRGIGGQLSAGVVNAVTVFVFINVALFVFNMIPFPPLDGSRVLYAFAPEGLQNVMRRIESLGFFGILIFMFLLFPLLGPLIIGIDDALLRLLLG